MALLILIGMLRIIATYTVFSQTADEPAHLAAGMEWLDRGRYRYEPQHPPLPRVAVAIGPYLDGLRSFGTGRMSREGNRILEARGRYSRNLALARAGTLPFFVIACTTAAEHGTEHRASCLESLRAEEHPGNHGAGKGEHSGSTPSQDRATSEPKPFAYCLPHVIDDQIQAVQAAPDHEGPSRAMPESAQ